LKLLFKYILFYSALFYSIVAYLIAFPLLHQNHLYFPPHSDRVPDRKNIREEGLICSWFQRVQFMVACFPALRQNILVGGTCGGGCSFHSGQEEWETRRGQGQDIHNDLSLVTYFLQLGPIF
jgi:hypothetical protein